MAEFVNPQFQNPDILRSMALGQQMANSQAMAPVQLAGAQQEQQYRGLEMDQIRQVMAKQGMLLDTANQIGALGTGQQSTQTGQQPGGATGGVQSGPQGSVAPPLSQDPLTDVMSDRRNALYQKMDLLAGRDPFTTQKLAMQTALEQKKLQLQGPINLAQQIQADPQANIVINNNPQLKQMFGQWAAARGMNPNDPTVLTVANAQRAARDYEGQLQGQLAQPSTAGFSGKLSPGESAYQNGQLVAGDPNGMTAFDRGKLGIEGANLGIAQQKLELEKQRQGAFTGQSGELGAALAERGVSLPSGFRSQQQQASLYNGLLTRHPDMSVDEIADLVKSGKISLAGDLKEQTTAGGIVGKVKYAENELTQSIPLALEASKNVPRGSFMPLNKLLQMANTSISDPDLLNLKIKTQSVMNAYDMLAARAGTDVGKREEQHKLLSNASSPEAYETALKAFAQEAQVAHKAGDISMGRTSATPSGGGPVTVNSPEEAMKLKPGTVFRTPDGRLKVR